MRADCNKDPEALKHCIFLVRIDLLFKGDLGIIPPPQTISGTTWPLLGGNVTIRNHMIARSFEMRQSPISYTQC